MIIVASGVKGGTGKSTITLHLATYLFLSGKKISTIDYDFPQFSFTRYYENRKKNKNASVWEKHQCIKDLTYVPEMNDQTIYIIDTPGHYNENIIKLHKHADVIITPINDSFMDIDTIMQVEHEKWVLPGSYYESILENKKEKKDSLWLVVRNRSSSINSKHKQNVEIRLQELAKKLNFTPMQGFKERNIFRELFTNGLSVLDMDQNKLAISHLAAKIEIKMLWKKILEHTDK